MVKHRNPSRKDYIASRRSTIGPIIFRATIFHLFFDEDPL